MQSMGVSKSRTWLSDWTATNSHPGILESGDLLGHTHRVPGKAPTALPSLSAPPSSPNQVPHPWLSAKALGSWDNAGVPWITFTSDFTPQPGWAASQPARPPVLLCTPRLLPPRSRGSSETLIWEDERRAGSCVGSTTKTLSLSPGPDRSVSCLAFLKTPAANLESASASLMTNGPRGEDGAHTGRWLVSKKRPLQARVPTGRAPRHSLADSAQPASWGRAASSQLSLPACCLPRGPWWFLQGHRAHRMLCSEVK